MIFSKNQIQALQFLNLKIYLKNSGTEEIFILDEVDKKDNLTKFPKLELKGSDKQDLENTDLSKLKEIFQEPSKGIKTQNLVKENNTSEKEQLKVLDNFSNYEQLEAKDKNLELPPELWANLELTIIFYKNLAFFLPPLIFNQGSYKLYLKPKELEIWEICFKKCGLEELADLFTNLAAKNFPALENQELPENFTADLIIIFANNKIRNLADKLKIPSIKCFHPAIAATELVELDKYKKLLWEDFKKMAEAVKLAIKN